MKTYLFTTLAVVSLGAVYLNVPATAENDNADIRVRAPFVAVDVDIDQEQRLAADKPARMSQLLGLTVRNSQHEELGKISDFVTGTRSGRIRYAALSLGGEMGMGEQLAAIPWKSLRLQYDKQKDEAYFELDVDKEALRQFPRVDTDEWLGPFHSNKDPEAGRTSETAGEDN